MSFSSRRTARRSKSEADGGAAFPGAASRGGGAAAIGLGETAEGLATGAGSARRGSTAFCWASGGAGARPSSKRPSAISASSRFFAPATVNHSS